MPPHDDPAQTSGDEREETSPLGSPELEPPDEAWVEEIDASALEALPGFDAESLELLEGWEEGLDESLLEGLEPDAFTVLVLASPHLKNLNVRRVQRLLNEQSTSVTGPDGVRCPEDLIDDGEFGPVTAHAVRAWKYRSGCPNTSPRLARAEFIALLRRAERGVKLRDLVVRKKDGTTTSWAEISIARKKRHDGTWRKGRGISPFAWDEAHKPDGKVKADAADTMVSWFESGLKENPAGSNRVPELEALARKVDGAVYRSMNWPWCQFAACLAHAMAGGHAGSEGLANRWNGLYTVDAVIRAQRGEFGMRLKPHSRIEKGDWLMMNFPGGSSICDHIGVAMESYAGPDVVRTVEGNTSYGSRGSQANGGAVATRVRPLSQIAYVIDPGGA